VKNLGDHTIETQRRLTIPGPFCFIFPLFLAIGPRFGMSAAHRVPWRAFKIDPVTVIGKTSEASTFGSSRSLQSNSLLRPSQRRSAYNALPWASQTNPIGRRFFSVKAPLLSKTEQAESREKANTGSQRRLVKWLVVAGVIGAGALAFSEQAGHAFGAAKRSGRVVGTLAVCINEYV
jgi:aarF domain-containing kinase